MSYEIPKAKLNTYFTKNLTEQNYKNGLFLLGYYYRNSPISKAPYYPITNFDGMVSYLEDNYPTYIESLGDLMKSVQQDKLIKAMTDAGKKGRTDYPRPSYFTNAIMDNTGISISAVIGDTAIGIGTDLIEYANIFSKIVLWGGIAFIVAYGIAQIGGVKSIKSFAKSVKG